MGIGNGKWEGGLVVPVNWNSIGGGWSLGADPESWISACTTPWARAITSRCNRR